jgi:Transglutaminase-like superfamily
VFVRIFSLERILTFLDNYCICGLSENTLDSSSVVCLVESCSWRFSWWNNCLVKSLVVLVLFRELGIDAKLKIGIEHPSCGTDAHAWLEDAENKVIYGDNGKMGSYSVFVA